MSLYTLLSEVVGSNSARWVFFSFRTCIGLAVAKLVSTLISLVSSNEEGVVVVVVEEEEEEEEGEDLSFEPSPFRRGYT